MEANDGASSFIRHDALLNRKERIFGYRISLHAKLKARRAERSPAVRRAYDLALLKQLGNTQGDTLLGRQFAFVHLSAASLNLAEVHALPARHTVLMLEDVPAQLDETFAARTADLKQRGFQLGIVLDEPRQPIPCWDWASHCAIESPRLDGVELKAVAARLREDAGPSMVLIATDLPSHDDFHAARHSGYDLFHGSFVTRLEDWRPPAADVNRAVVLPLLAMLRQDTPNTQIAEQLRREPVLTWRLLRYLNSPACGMQRQITNLSQALSLLGRERLYRWLSLLLFDFRAPNYRGHLLATRALTFARIMEMLAGQGGVPVEAENLFLTGLFCELDTLLGRPLDELLSEAALPPMVAAALLQGSGPLAPALNLVRLAEFRTELPFEAVANALVDCQIRYRDFTAIAAYALVWAHEVLSGSD